jgi:hypothetical protein
MMGHTPLATAERASHGSTAGLAARGGGMNQLLSFYYGTHPDHKGRMLSEIVTQNDYWLEKTHDYIQWIFPLVEMSQGNTHAPLVDRETITAFQNDELLQIQMRGCLARMMGFLGLQFDGKTLEKASNWNPRRDDWFTVQSHHSLRITRILKSMTLLGLAKEALALHKGLETLCRTESDCGITEESRDLWRRAVR